MTTPALQIEQLLQDLAQDEHPEATACISALIQREKSALAEAFYAYMLKHPEATLYLSAATVEAHLKPGLQRWLETLFCQSSAEELKSTLALQRHVGEVHARAGIPIPLVARGMRLLKSKITRALMDSALDREVLSCALQRVHHLIDFAFETMSLAYVKSREVGIRTDEAFRHFAAGHNMAMEREKQLGAILEWENRLFRALANGWSLDSLPPIALSPFGLWYRHKAPLIFGENHEFPLIDAAITNIDQSLLTQMTDPALIDTRSPLARKLIQSLQEEAEQIRFLLNTAFDRLTEMEVGRDTLTQLFNRRFLPTILKREIMLSRRKNTQFAILMLDIDAFKSINDQHGHDGGDRVLQQLAQLIFSTVRAGDFVFRYGGEEFLVVLTEVDPRQAEDLAQNMRRRVEAARITLSAERTIQATVSIGIATHDGHPDYMNLVERADQALYLAKNAGRNCCQLAPE